ncbi:MAG: family 43 glycosylhydrolase [Acholeplasmataceae bacterium]
MKNPVLKGFNPDPSACVYKDKVYVAVSTFQWVPGITIYETSDLAHYKIVSSPLKDIDLRGNPIDTSIWAPQLSYYDGLFYLIYTEVKVTIRPYKDLHNYVMTASSIEGPWSKPVYVNSSGFDPSFYHEKDQSYFINEIWDYRKKEDNKFAGIIMQPFDRKTMSLKDEPKIIFNGTEAKKTEGPHLYKINDYYYLITAEGGTKETHQVTVARSKDIFGPYEVDPQNPMLTSKNNPLLDLQCAGHASMILFKGQYYMFHLSTRGYPSILGRETSIQKVFIKDGWIRLEEGCEPFSVITGLPDVTTHAFNQDFAKPLTNDWMFLRRLHESDWMKPSYDGLIIAGSESLSSPFDVSLLGIRLTEFDFETKLTLSYQPSHYNHLAGLGLYLDETKHIYLYLTFDETNHLVARLYKKHYPEYIVYDEMIKLDGYKHELKIVVKDLVARFYVDDQRFDTEINIGFLIYNFTGTMITISAHDLNRRYQQKATLHKFTYEPK